MVSPPVVRAPLSSVHRRRDPDPSRPAALQRPNGKVQVSASAANGCSSGPSASSRSAGSSSRDWRSRQPNPDRRHPMLKKVRPLAVILLLGAMRPRRSRLRQRRRPGVDVREHLLSPAPTRLPPPSTSPATTAEAPAARSGRSARRRAESVTVSCDGKHL